MKKNGNEKTELKLQKKYTLSDNWNAYDPFGEVFFFAAGPFFKHLVFLAPAFAFGCGDWFGSNWLRKFQLRAETEGSFIILRHLMTHCREFDTETKRRIDW